MHWNETNHVRTFASLIFNFYSLVAMPPKNVFPLKTLRPGLMSMKALNSSVFEGVLIDFTVETRGDPYH